MFNPRKPESSSHTAANGDYAKVSSSVAPVVRSAYGSADANYSIINEWLTMRGDLESEQDILVKGRVHGNIQCKLLIIDADAFVEGGITAEEVIVRGKTKGTIKAKRVRLEKTAHVDSEISHESFSAEEGARITGALKFSSEPMSYEAKVTPPPLN